jgi:hypothetical protein
MAEPSYPVALVPASLEAIPRLQRGVATLGPAWTCRRVDELPALIAERRIRLVLTAPRDLAGTLVAEGLSSLAAGGSHARLVQLYSPTVPSLSDARVVAETGACVTHLLEPVKNHLPILRAVLSPRWRRGPAHCLLRGLVRPLTGSAKTFGTLCVLRPWAASHVGDVLGLLNLPERRVQRDFAHSVPTGAAAGGITPHRFARLTLSLTVAWWLANGRRVDQLVSQLGFLHRYALAEQVKKYLGRPPGAFTRPRDFRTAYVEVLRSFRLA